MKSWTMKSLLLAGVLTCAADTICVADGGYWIVGNRTTSTCDIVTSNPVVDGSIGPIWFGSGPYQSMDDAKLARSTIGACPKDESSAG